MEIRRNVQDTQKLSRNKTDISLDRKKDKRTHRDEFCSLHHAKNARIGT